MTWKSSPHFIKGRGGRKPIAVVIHTMVGTLAGTDAWFKNPASNVSAHYGVGLSGEVHQYVKEEDVAYHAGRVYNPVWPLLVQGINPNLYTIGIEHEDMGNPEHGRTDALYKASAVLVREICDRWGIPIDSAHVVRHRDIYARKTCPGSLDIGRIIREAKQQEGVSEDMPIAIERDVTVEVVSQTNLRSVPTEEAGKFEITGELGKGDRAEVVNQTSDNRWLAVNAAGVKLGWLKIDKIKVVYRPVVVTKEVIKEVPTREIVEVPVDRPVTFADALVAIWDALKKWRIK